MKLSKYIKGLQEFMDKHGDLPCYYSSDDEGNSYQGIECFPDIMFSPDLNEWQPEMYDESDKGDLDIFDGDETFSPVCIVN
jgi:hypothetical protein